MTKKSILIITILIAAALGAGYFYVANHNAKADNSKTSGNRSSDTSDAVDYNPATSDQQNAAGTGGDKDNTDQDPNTTPDQNDQTGSNSKNTVEVLITTHYQQASGYTVNGMVNGVTESGGTCTLKMTKDGVTRQASRPAVSNVSNTSCGASTIPLSSLSSGTWTATLTYSSKTSTGVSAPVKVEVTR